MGRKAFYIVLAGLILSLLSTDVRAQAPIPLAGTFSNIAGSPPLNLNIQFLLVGCGANTAQVVGGTNFSIVQLQTSFFPNPNTGVLTGNIWPNDVITCGATTGETNYSVTFIVNNIPQGPPTCYHIFASMGTFNLNTATPCVTSGFSAKRRKN